jgi:glycerate kinase
MHLRKIIVAPDSFKATLPAVEVADAIAAGVRRVCQSIIVDQCPVADGGEGTMNALIRATGGEVRSIRVTGPMWNDVQARYALMEDHRIGVVEMAEASGLALVPPEQRDPMHATSFGTGELMNCAMSAGCAEIIVCIGGSATVDGGTGMAQASSFRFFDLENLDIEGPMCGAVLHEITRIQRPSIVWPRIRVACDVTNPLCGPNGAAAVYGPQKGASPEQVRLLDEGLAHLAKVAGGDPNMPGAGAAGGAGYGLVTFFNATLERGIDLVLEAVRFRDRCRGADLVLTGEGRLDAQTLQGKACMGVAEAARELGVPTIAIVGSTESGAEEAVKRGLLMSYHSLANRYGMERAMRETKALLADLTEEVVRALMV